MALPYEFLVPDVMFADELLDLGSYTRDDLLEAGLKVGGLDSDGVAVAFRYAERCVEWRWRQSRSTSYKTE